MQNYQLMSSKPHTKSQGFVQAYIRLSWFLVFIGLVNWVHAAPDLQSAHNIKGVTIFADHQKPDTFYYLKSSKKLLWRDQAPDFHYLINRYIGNRKTGDEDVFWVRGVVKFTTITDFAELRYKDIVDQLEEKHAKTIHLIAAPVMDSFNKLVYATIKEEPGELRQEGEFEGGYSSESSSVNSDAGLTKIFGSRQQRYTIGLTSNDANLFWESFQRGKLNLSLAYGWVVSGVVKDESDGWLKSSYSVNDTVPIRVSMQEHPHLFTKNELWQKVQFAHSELTIMCYDFINLEKSELYNVTVDVRFETLRNQQYEDRVKFIANSDEYEKLVSFELINDIKQGYEYRVRRLSMDGTRTDTGWLQSNSAWLDVSLSVAELSELELLSDNHEDGEQNL